MGLKSFTRGHKPSFMDRIVSLTKGLIPWSAVPPSCEIPLEEDIRKAMGVTRMVAERVELAKIFPESDLASTGYCLANPGKECLVYLSPNTKDVYVDLSQAKGTLNVELIHPTEGAIKPVGKIIRRQNSQLHQSLPS